MTAYRRNGKQVLRGNAHFADAADEHGAQLIVDGLNRAPHPVAFMRRCAFDGEEGTPGNRPRGWKLHAVTTVRCLPDDVVLYANEPRPPKT